MEHFEHNRASWNELTSIHVDSDFYDVNGFKKGKSSLNSIEVSEIGDVTGKTLLHLQCHFGLDTLSFARLGAKVTGVDISDESIKTARELSDELSVPATFIRSNIYEIDNVVNDKYDIIFTSYGAINWLDDLNKWAEIINRFLKPGGFFYMVEFHPYIYSLNEDLEIGESYFKASKIETKLEGTYTDSSRGVKQNLMNVEWHHSLSEVVNSLTGNNLKIEFLNEYPYQVYNCFGNMIEIDKGKWVFEKYRDKIPYMYSLKAIKI